MELVDATAPQEAPEESAREEPPAPNEEESSEPAQGAMEPPAVSLKDGTALGVEALAAAALDAEAENPIIPPSVPPREES